VNQAESFYTELPLFSTAPSEQKSITKLSRFGPVGLSLELRQPAFTLVVGKIEPGSPAAVAGGFKQGQIIQTINGRPLSDIDPRIQFGNTIEAAEASDGVLKFEVQDGGKGTTQEIVVNIPVLGAYSATWPLDCAKSERIVREFADYLAQPDANKGFADAGMLFLLSTGDDGDLPPVRDWVHALNKGNHSGYPWHIGYGGLAVCEYYLRTGDPVALELIQDWVDAATESEYLDGWAGRGGVVRLGYGNGHLNAAGTHVVTFLLLAKQCGAKIDDSLLHRSLVHLFRYAGRGLNPYGDHRPETSFVDNGKNGKLAFAMAAAASLTPEGEDSLYARARDIAALSSFYTTTYMLHGHTGGGIGELWRSAGMGLVHDLMPGHYREFMDHRKWHYDMSRRFDGSFAILGGARYDNVEWGNLYPFTYTVPRKTLRITGAPPSKYSKSYQLPQRPWGTEADDAFLSMAPAADKEGHRHDISGETFTEDSGLPFIRRLNQEPPSDEVIRQYVRHPEYLIRHTAANLAGGLSATYMFSKPGQRVRHELLEEFARHADARVRYAGLQASIHPFDPEAEWSQRMFDYAIERLGDDAESWFVKDACLALIGKGTPDMLIPHLDLLIGYLDHSEQWLQNGALMVLAELIDDERCYAQVMPPVGKTISSTPRQSTTMGPLRVIGDKLPKTSGSVRTLALETFGDVYVNYSGGDSWPGGQDLRRHQQETLEVFAETLTNIPGGYDVLYEVAKKRHPHDPLPYSQLFLRTDPEKFGPDLRESIKPIIRDELIYQFIGEHRRSILSDTTPDDNRRATVTNTIDELVALYQRIDVHDYDWKNFGPELREAEWSYYSFDPSEKQKYDISPWRYRSVTYPEGMKGWFNPGFDPAEAGWEKGLFPIGQYIGELRTNGSRNPWNQVPRTFWEDEVLLVHGSFEFPETKPGHMYRVRVQTGQGVGAGDGFKVYVNGKELVEAEAGLGRRQGDDIRGGWITSEFMDEFGSGPVTLAATSFLRYGDRAIIQMPPVSQGIFSMWVEARKVPPLDEEVLRKAATFMPMLSSEWQAGIDPESNEPPSDEGKFRYDGDFVPNPAVNGSWVLIDQVESIAEFAPDGKMNPGCVPFRKITFANDGSTDKSDWIWSGDRLMDIKDYVAHKITPHTIDNTEYLFIEAGEFSPRHPAGWTSPLWVFKRP
jgi:hypothetical protein